MLENHEPAIGKNVIETLSEGMYDNPLFLFREYIQNAADAIDAAEHTDILKKGEGQIEVHVDFTKRLITFEDNGTGIPKDMIKKCSPISVIHRKTAGQIRDSGESVVLEA
jgi:molecular chaperone HtpG